MTVHFSNDSNRAVSDVSINDQNSRVSVSQREATTKTLVNGKQHVKGFDDSGNDSNRQISGIYSNDENSKIRATEIEAAARALAEAKRLEEKQQRDKEQQERERERRLADLETAKTRLEGETTNLEGKVKTLESEKSTLQSDLRNAKSATREMETGKTQEIDMLKKEYLKENPPYPNHNNVRALWAGRRVYFINMKNGKALDAGWPSPYVHTFIWDNLWQIWQLEKYAPNEHDSLWRLRAVSRSDTQYLGLANKNHGSRPEVLSEYSSRPQQKLQCWALEQIKEGIVMIKNVECDNAALRLDSSGTNVESWGRDPGQLEQRWAMVAAS